MISTLEVTCPKCGAGPGQRCRTLTTNRSTDTHEARASARWAWPDVVGVRVRRT